MSSRICPNCGSNHIEQHDASGASVCTECGVVLEENAIVSAVEYVENAGGASSMVGKFVSATSSKAYTGQGGRGGYGFSRDSRETTLANGRRRIQEVASRLRLGGHYVDSAHRWFTIAVEKNFVQGRRTIHVVAACLYIACRQEKSQHMLIDFSDALQVNVYTLGTCFLKFRRLLGLKLEIVDPALYVYRFAAHLDLDDKANAVALTALRLVGRMRRDWIVAGRRPAGVCAAALMIASRAYGFARHPQDLSRILRVCGLTVTTRVREFESTQSAALTLDQFNKVELEAEADPPIFTKNRIREARAQAIQEKNFELLTSGALDNPLAGKKSQKKWRELSATDERKAEFERLYSKIEMDLTQHQAKYDAEETARNNKSSPKQVAGPKTTGEESPDNAETTPNKADATPTADTALAIVDKVVGAQNQMTEIPKAWANAYPRSKFGKAIILPTHFMPEERLPPTAPVQGKLDLKTWKASMPQTMVDDVESMFRDPTQVAQKEAIFNKINKDYIDLQAQKEKHRETAVQAQTQEDKEMIEQAQGHERYRKRKSRGRDATATTEEALLEAVSSRKISRKINYDAMSAIFDDNGTFSTGAGGALGEEPQISDFQEV